MIAVALVLIVVALWISVVRIQALGVGSVLAISALAPFVAGFVALTTARIDHR